MCQPDTATLHKARHRKIERKSVRLFSQPIRGPILLTRQTEKGRHSKLFFIETITQSFTN